MEVGVVGLEVGSGPGVVGTDGEGWLGGWSTVGRWVVRVVGLRAVPRPRRSPPAGSTSCWGCSGRATSSKARPTAAGLRSAGSAPSERTPRRSCSPEPRRAATLRAFHRRGCVRAEATNARGRPQWASQGLAGVASGADPLDLVRDLERFLPGHHPFPVECSWIWPPRSNPSRSKATSRRPRCLGIDASDPGADPRRSRRLLRPCGMAACR